MALVAIGVVGCSSSKKTADISTNGSVTDISPAPVTTYQPAPQPVAQPVSYETTTPQASGGLASGSYTVKKGDTLYNIAVRRYGDGKQWTKIASANPGLQPSSLKIGQTITVP